MKKLWILMALALMACACSKEEPAPLPPLKAVELPKNTDGLYSGRLPCDNCKARMIRMTLAPDSSALAIETLVTDSMKSDTLRGVYSVDGDILSVSLSDASVNWKFKRDSKGNLALMTSAGTVYEDADGLKAELIRIYIKEKIKVDSSAEVK